MAQRVKWLGHLARGFGVLVSVAGFGVLAVPAITFWLWVACTGFTDGATSDWGTVALGLSMGLLPVLTGAFAWWVLGADFQQDTVPRLTICLAVAAASSTLTITVAFMYLLEGASTFG